MMPIRPPSIQKRLGLLVILCSVPILLAAAGLYFQNYALERTALVQQSVASARNVAQLVDAKFGAAEAVLQSLAALPSLRSGALDSFLIESAYTTPPEWLSGLLLTSVSGDIVYDSSHLSSSARPLSLGQLGAERLSEPFYGGIADEPVVALTVPVEVKGKHVMNLTGLLRAQEFTKLYLSANTPESWLFSIVDEHGHIISRSSNLPQLFAKLANPSLLGAMNTSDEGSFNGATAEGRKVLAVFSRAPNSRWVVAIGIPTEELADQLRMRLILSGAVLLLAVGLAISAVWVVARNIASSVRELRSPALALGRGEMPQLPNFYFGEAQEVGNELLKAADLLRSAQHRANHDALTGVPNRVLFGHLLDQQLAVASRTRTAFSVLFVDLDGFKAVNDTLGHSTGDELLVQVAKRMQVHIRAADTVARLGGDEFAILLFGAGADDGIRVAEGLLDAISFPYRLDDHSCSVSASIGMATYPEDGCTAEELLHRSDAAMYAAKNHGKGRVMAYRALSTAENGQPRTIRA